MALLIPQDIFWQRHKQLNSKLINYPFSENFSTALDEACNLGKIIDFSDRETLGELIRAILYIVIPKENFKQEIIERLQIPPAYAEIINQIIQQRIFEPLKNELEQYRHLLPKKPFEITKPLEIPEAETIKTEEIKELVQKPKPLEAAKTEVITKKEILQEEALPDLSQPEIPEIKIERPVDRTGGLKRIIMPSTSPEAQEKIHSKLMAAMNKKEAKPKIVEEMKKVVTEGIKKTPQQKPEPKTTPETEESITSQVIGGEGEQFTPQEKAPKSSLEKPYIFDVKLKEEPSVAKAMEGKEEEKKEIKYQKPAEKPFGEA
jgi:hypothetical protein